MIMVQLEKNQHVVKIITTSRSVDALDHYDPNGMNYYNPYSSDYKDPRVDKVRAAVETIHEDKSKTYTDIRSGKAIILTDNDHAVRLIGGTAITYPDGKAYFFFHNRTQYVLCEGGEPLSPEQRVDFKLRVTE